MLNVLSVGADRYKTPQQLRCLLPLNKEPPNDDPQECNLKIII